MTADPELRRTQNGTAVASFTMAVDRDFKNQNGEKETDFINCVAWKGSAEFASNYFSKGQMAIVDGRLQMREWADKDGNKRKSAEIQVSNIYFADSKKDEYTAPQYPQQNNEFQEIEDEEPGNLPF